MPHYCDNPYHQQLEGQVRQLRAEVASKEAAAAAWRRVALTGGAREPVQDAPLAGAPALTVEERIEAGRIEREVKRGDRVAALR